MITDIVRTGIRLRVAVVTGARQPLGGRPHPTGIRGALR
jgi:hypothetical protein